MLFGWLLPLQLIALGTVWTICSLFCQHASCFRCSFHFFWKLKNGCGVKLRMFARHAVRRIFHRKDNNLYPTVVPLPPIIAGIQRHSVHRKKIMQSVLIPGICVLASHCKCWIHECGAIALTENIGIAALEFVVATFSVYICMKTLSVMLCWFINSGLTAHRPRESSLNTH